MLGLETEDVAHGAGEIHVVADLGLAVGVEEFGRGVGGGLVPMVSLPSLVTDSGSSAAIARPSSRSSRRSW